MYRLYFSAKRPAWHTDCVNFTPLLYMYKKKSLLPLLLYKDSEWRNINHSFILLLAGLWHLINIHRTIYPPCIQLYLTLRLLPQTADQGFRYEEGWSICKIASSVRANSYVRWVTEVLLHCKLSAQGNVEKNCFLCVPFPLQRIPGLRCRMLWLNSDMQQFITWHQITLKSMAAQCIVLLYSTMKCTFCTK